ncbi:MAG TPA: hypothetical protein VGA38_02275 [Candidatus Limnocylindria bacterium]
MKDLLNLVRTAIWLAFFAALYQELRKPAEERTWHGKVAGVVPYDFRLPTIDRVRQAYWNPESETVFTEKVVGVGWAVNLPTALKKVSQIASQYASTIQRRSED